MKEIENDMNRKKSHVHQLEKLLLFKFLYYTKQYAGTVQSLSNFQWYFLTEVETILKSVGRRGGDKKVEFYIYHRVSLNRYADRLVMSCKKRGLKHMITWL